MTAKPANAGAITRTLKAANLPHSVLHRSGMVRGWGTWSRGFHAEHDMKHGSVRVAAGRYRDGSQRYKRLSANTPTGWVMVDWNHGDGRRDWSTEDRNAERDRQLAKAREVLEAKGYHVEHREMGTARAVLRVCRKDANGEVVT